MGWFKATREQLVPLYTFIEITSILPIDDIVIEKTIGIRQVKKIGLGDAIIAATALANNLVLLSRNTSDFKEIEGLKVIDLYKV